MDFRDDLYFLNLTVLMEAGGEPYEGKLAVAYVVVNLGPSIIDTVFKPWKFSAWNTDNPGRLNIDTTPTLALKECFKASCAAYFKLAEDPSRGANHYLNEIAVLKNRGVLPRWFDLNKVVARIGKHTFLKL